MVFWASPNVDSDRSSVRRDQAIANIKDLQGNKSLVASLEATEKSIKSSSGGLTCIEGSIYKVPFLTVTAENREKSSSSSSSSEPPAAKRQKTAATPKGKGVSTKGKGKTAKGKTASVVEDPPEEKSPIPDASAEVVVSMQSYPPSDIALSQLKKAATSIVLDASSGSSEGSSTPSTSKTQKGSKGKKTTSSTVGLIERERIILDNGEDWRDRGLKTPLEKILKTIVDKTIDPKTVAMNLVRLKLVGEEGLASQLEETSGNHIATLLVVLPLKVGRFVQF